MSLRLIGALTLGALCTASASDLTIYSGRSKTFVQPIVQQFEKQTGLKVKVRYGSDAQLVAALREEGDRSPADVFWGNSMGALGTLAADGRFTTLPKVLTKNINPDYLPQDKSWLPITVRFRSLAFNSKKFKTDDLPASVFDLPKMKHLKGKIGWTTTYPSFHDFLSVMLDKHGEKVTRQWLTDMKALNPKDFKRSNVGMLEAIRSGEIDVGLTNHYYVQRVIRLKYPIDTHFFKSRDVGNLGNATGAGILKTSKHKVAATRLLKMLGTQNAQTFFLSVNFEYPVIDDLIQPTTMLPYKEVSKRNPRVDPSIFHKNNEKVQKILRDLGLL